MLRLIRAHRKNRRIAKRLISLLTLSIAHGGKQRDIMSHIRHQVYLSKFTGDSITDSDLHAWREHWILALNVCYDILRDSKRDLSKSEKDLLQKSEADFVKVLARNNNIEVLAEMLELFVDNERYEVAAFVRDLINEHEKTEIEENEL
jgi:hypothetical protein